MKTLSENPEVLYPDQETVVAGRAEIKTLKDLAAASPRKRARLCAHRAPSAPVHEMLIVLHRESYVRPHRHVDKTESFTILEGEADLVLFHDDGQVREIIAMGPPSSGKIFFHRLSQPVYHTVVARTDWLVVQEVTTGPFVPRQTQFPDWAPDGSDADRARSFTARLNLSRP